MSGREVGMRGVVEPDVDDRRLADIGSRIEEEMERASTIAPDLDLGRARRQIERLVPGGRQLGRGLDRVRGRLSDSTQQRTSGGDMSTTALMSAQLNELEEINEKLEKTGVSQARSGGGGDQGLAQQYLTLRGLGSLTGSSSALGSLSSVAATGSLFAGGALAGRGVTGGAERFLQNQAPESVQDMGNGLTRAFDRGGALGVMSQFAGNGIRQFQQGDVQSTLPELPSVEVDLPSELEGGLGINVPSVLEQGINVDVPSALRDLKVDVPDWLKRFLPDSQPGRNARGGMQQHLPGPGTVAAENTRGTRQNRAKMLKQRDAGVNLQLGDIQVNERQFQQQVERAVENAIQGFDLDGLVTDILGRKMGGGL